jgi:hypothetical protein
MPPRGLNSNTFNQGIYNSILLIYNPKTMLAEIFAADAAELNSRTVADWAELTQELALDLREASALDQRFLKAVYPNLIKASRDQLTNVSEIAFSEDDPDDLDIISAPLLLTAKAREKFCLTLLAQLADTTDDRVTLYQTLGYIPQGMDADNPHIDLEAIDSIVDSKYELRIQENKIAEFLMQIRNNAPSVEGLSTDALVDTLSIMQAEYKTVLDSSYLPECLEYLRRGDTRPIDNGYSVDRAKLPFLIDLLKRSGEAYYGDIDTNPDIVVEEPSISKSWGANGRYREERLFQRVMQKRGGWQSDNILTLRFGNRQIRQEVRSGGDYPDAVFYLIADESIQLTDQSVIQDFIDKDGKLLTGKVDWISISNPYALGIEDNEYVWSSFDSIGRYSVRQAEESA